MEFLSTISKLRLGMFIPGIGTGIGIFSGFSTGMVFSAMAETSPSLVMLLH